MTKKAQKIYQTYCHKLDLIFWRYENESITFTEFEDTATKEKNDFHDLVCNMFQYDLLSLKDFDELFTNARPTLNEYINKAYKLKLEKVLA